MDTQSLLLVVDAEPGLRKLITDFLSGHGYRVAAARSAAEMRRMLATEHPELVILDVMMPDQGGISSGTRPFAGQGYLYEFAAWRLDILRRVLRDPRGLPVELSDKEFALLRTFVEHPQSVLSRSQLLNHPRASAPDVHDRAIDTQISRLRRKLSERTDGEWIRTIHNQGYMFVPPVSRL